MRKQVLILITLLLTTIIVSCGNDKKTQGSEVQYTESQNEESVGNVQESESDILEENDSEALEIYYVSDDINSAKLVSAYREEHPEVKLNLVSFSDVEKMDQQIAAVVNSGQGPDVILFPSNTSLDAAKMGRGNAFMDMTELLEGDSGYDAANYYPVIDAGKVGGKQVYMPLRMQVQYLLTTEEKMSDGFIVSEGYDASELFKAVEAAAESCAEDMCTIHIMSKQTITGILYDNIRLMGIDIVDLETDEYVIEDGTFRDLAEFSKLTYQEVMKSVSLMQKYSRDFIGGFNRLKAYWFTDSLPYNMRYYESIMRSGVGEKIKILAYPNLDDSETITADIVLYAGILSNTDNVEDAYSFIRYAMDMPMAGQNYDLSVNKEVVQSLLNEMTFGVGGSVNIGSYRVIIHKLSPESIAECEGILDKISAGSIRNGGIEAIMKETMEPYILGEADFDSCYTKFKNKVEIYLYE